MNEILSLITPNALILITITAVFAGLVKGIVGFAMPMIFITSVTIFMSPDVALGILILPTLIGNGWQAGRQGFTAAYQALLDHRWFLGVGYTMLLVTTQMVPLVPQSLFFLYLGILVVVFASLMLIGWQPKGRSGTGLLIGCALVAGVGGGLSGIWGPPTVMYLSTHNLEKQAQMRAQGVIYGLGAIILLIGHVKSGIATLPVISLGAFAILPACFGIWVGFKIQDLINQKIFRIATLSILILSGLNLIRRGIM